MVGRIDECDVGARTGRSAAAGTRPLASALVEVVKQWANAQAKLVALAAEFADSNEWVLESPTAAHWLASAADVEPCTAREWIRIGHKLKELSEVAAAFETGLVSAALNRGYSAL